MRIRPKQQAQTAVRAINDLVGEATDRIEDVLPHRRKQSHRKQKWFGAVAVTAIAAFAAKYLYRRRAGDDSTTGDQRPATSNLRRDPGQAAFDLDRERESLTAPSPLT